MDKPKDVGVPTGEPTPDKNIPTKPTEEISGSQTELPQNAAQRARNLIPKPTGLIPGSPRMQKSKREYEEMLKQKQGNKAINPVGKGKKRAGSASDNAAKKGGKALAKAAGAAIKKAAVAAVTWAAGLVGWPVVIGCGVLFLIILLVFGSLAAYYVRGSAGKTIPQRAGKNDPNIAKILAFTKEQTGETSGFFAQASSPSNMKVNFLNARDLEYIQSGQVDKRLLASLVYLAEHHEHIRISHIVSGYEDMQTNVESGSFHDKQLAKNISAHKDGLAADIDEIDYVDDKCDCGTKIPVKVQWQSIGENPYVQTPDALNKIDSPDSFGKEEVKKALKDMGVSGLDQRDLVEKIKASVTLSKITNVYDLMKPEVISAFAAIGVNGIDNEQLQSGLKRLQALQQLYQMNLSDISALQNPQVQELFSTIGVPISDELIDSIGKYQASQVLQTIKSLDDLKRTDVQQALQKLGVNTDDPNFRKALDQITAAGTIANWQGDLNSPALIDALGKFDITLDDNTKKALNILQAAKSTFGQSGNQMNNDVMVVQTLEQLAIYTNSPELQDVINKYKAAYKIKNYQGDYTSPDFLNALSDLGFNLTPDEQAVLNKYKAAQNILNYQGDLTDPQFVASLAAVGINLSDQNKEYLAKIKASEVLADAASGKIALDSQQVKDALKTIGAGSMEDAKAKAAVKLGTAKDPDDPNVQEEKRILGLTASDALDIYAKFKAAKNLSNLHDFSSLQDPNVQKSLQTLGLKDPKYYDALTKIGAATGLLSIHNLSDLQKPGVQNSLKTLGIKDPKVYEALGKLGSLQTLLQVHSIKDLQSPYVQDALKNLGIKDPAVYENIARLSSVYTLLEIKGPWDLTKPEVVDALGNLKLADPALQAQLKEAGALYSLTQIKSPQDLLKYENLKALDQLGIISLNDKLMGQIGAIQTLLQVDSLQDLMNPSSILALNTLGIISLSNPITTALMVVSFIDNLMGGKLLGGILGGDNCKANTKCYKPTAQENVYKVVENLLQMPYDLGNKEQYRVTQLVVYSLEYTRSKDPSLDSKLNKLYWFGRPANVGLFTMPEAWQNIHIGY